jgi:hypothetical protein
MFHGRKTSIDFYDPDTPKEQNKGYRSPGIFSQKLLLARFLFPRFPQGPDAGAAILERMRLWFRTSTAYAFDEEGSGIAFPRA